MGKEELTPEVKAARKANYKIQPLILNRWSPRSMTAESMSDEELMPLFEAARWAPSSYNNQPWRFLYAKRDTPEWDLFFDLLVDANKQWAKNAAVLVVVISSKLFERNRKPSRTHTYDSGSAWMALALEGSSRGYVTHGMEGFDYDKAKNVLAVPDEFQVEAMIAIGKRAPKEKLSSELQAREAPNSRKALEEICYSGKFRG